MRIYRPRLGRTGRAGGYYRLQPAEARHPNGGFGGKRNGARGQTGDRERAPSASDVSLIEALPLRADTPTFPTDWLLPIFIARAMRSSTDAFAGFSCSSGLKAHMGQAPGVGRDFPR